MLLAAEAAVGGPPVFGPRIFFLSDILFAFAVAVACVCVGAAEPIVVAAGLDAAVAVAAVGDERGIGTIGRDMKGTEKEVKEVW